MSVWTHESEPAAHGPGPELAPADRAIHRTDLSEEDAGHLLTNLIGWWLQSLADGSAIFVSSKFSSALVTYFIHFSQRWPRCVLHLLHCLVVGQSLPFSSLDDGVDASVLVQSLDPRRLRAALCFAESLAEEVRKTDMTSPK